MKTTAERLVTEREEPKRPRLRPGRVLLYAALALGVVLLVLAVVTYIRTKNERSKLIETQGTIVELPDGTGPNGSKMPILEYTVDGKTYRIRSGYYSSGMALGQQIRVLYPASDPAAGRTNGISNIGSIFLLVFGVFLIGYPLLYLRAEKKAAQHREEAEALRQYGADPSVPVPQTSAFFILFPSMFLYLGCVGFGLAALFLILYFADPAFNFYIIPIICAAFGAVFTAIGVFVRKLLAHD